MAKLALFVYTHERQQKVLAESRFLIILYGCPNFEVRNKKKGFMRARNNNAPMITREEICSSPYVVSKPQANFLFGRCVDVCLSLTLSIS
jgi:hypothetical protein